LASENRKSLIIQPEKRVNEGEDELILTNNIDFVCPQCGKPTLSMHRKTYERSLIIFCTNCRLNTVLIPSKDAYYDMKLAYNEFIAKYDEKKAQEKPLAP
jgi:transcription elongation factor Elf1